MERSIMSLSSLLVLACLVGYGTTQSVQNVSAHWVDFFAKEYDWDMNKAKDPRYMMPISLTNGATNIIGPTSVISPVFRLTKLVAIASIATGDEITVRIIGPTVHGLELDKPMFDQLDSDGQGQDVGHLIVSYKFMNCDPTPPGLGESNVRADYSKDYNPIENDWTYPSHAECAIKDADSCGKCLKVTNTDTTDSVTVRIMDTCSGEVEALVLDYETAFKPIDTDGKAYEAGYLTVDYEFVECDDDVLVYSQ
ncbi:hypothetical protein F3Y22_tig00003435pilonHSYRG00087 [Hibiscus syriacus]|uniref:Barwin domain-containing protein n=1 Tax=Hibiscus syriacus TaxID=106335 RepID=A0A6A3CQ09_HIBSY|nr:hypothetical protein F3Y22_tig00003435pilonHSYRG00087 [Hibiscus syriacus]